MNESQKYQVILHGMTSNNVSKTCKEFGISRTLYYRWYNAYMQDGMAGLGSKDRRPVMPNQVDRTTEKIILQYVARFPQDGPKRIYYELQDEGVRTGESGIYNVLRRHGLNRREDRERYAREIKAKKRTSRGKSNSAGNQVKQQNPLDYNMNNSDHARPGYICFQTIQYIGKFPNVGKLYQYINLDSYSRLALVKLCNQKSTMQLIDFMRFKIMPLLRTFHLEIDNLVTNKSQEFSTAWERGNHMYTEYLHKHNINSVTYGADHPEVFQPLHEFTTVLGKEFYKPVWHEGRIDSFDTLEQRLNEYMNYYNYTRPLGEGNNQGKIPSDIVLDFRGVQEPLPLWLYTRR
ncbi:Transposase [Paenibacillus uliginis N3/975]|uniref:Transposase n=1 Tax=Paenibacillus uliginis N3/975 TaxID=1313296 RepID=A0A1X7HPE7_9BACL|nr:helix-turn-helix domain-containing protein [Paenibacillus uliginis]SMF90311.1 Transposase [Paenibacillus uliginis N3/975]